MKKLYFDEFFGFSEKINKCYYTKFTKGLNVVYGRNTSGKSSFLQSLLYTMGINDNVKNIKSLLSEEVIFRLNCYVSEKEIKKDLVFIRDDSVIIIFWEDRYYRFTGISGDSSAEHMKLKKFVSNIFDFKLMLEQKGELKEAPIEALFLPYYIAQSAGWVYLRKSFSNFEFYRDFKTDYLDYYLGISTNMDRMKKLELELKLKKSKQEYDILATLTEKDTEFNIALNKDEERIEEAHKYLEKYNERISELEKLKSEFINESNKLTLFERRSKVLNQISRNYKKYNLVNGKCPTCNREYINDIESIYVHYQNENDTRQEKSAIKGKLKMQQGMVNSLSKKLSSLEKLIEEKFIQFQTEEDFSENIKIEDWIAIKAISKMDMRIKQRIIDQQKNIEAVKEKLKEFKSGKEIETDRRVQEKKFKKKFDEYLVDLDVDTLTEKRYTDIYSISSFPYQGVELHKTIIAYHFAFNEFIKNTNNIHRLPFVLDAIFKEDLDEENEKAILKFIGSKSPNDTQTIFSVANSKKSRLNLKHIKTYLGVECNEIAIGNLEEKKALLSYDLDDYETNCELTYSHIDKSI